MATFRRGQANTSIVRGRKRAVDQSQEYHGNVPVGDVHNLRGFATAGTPLGGTMKGTRPDVAVSRS